MVKVGEAGGGWMHGRMKKKKKTELIICNSIIKQTVPKADVQIKRACWAAGAIKTELLRRRQTAGLLRCSASCSIPLDQETNTQKALPQTRVMIAYKRVAACIFHVSACRSPNRNALIRAALHRLPLSYACQLRIAGSLFQAACPASLHKNGFGVVSSTPPRSRPRWVELTFSEGSKSHCC